MAAGTCTFCNCTDATPCDGGCAWTDAAKTICSACARAQAIARGFVAIVARVASGNLHAPLDAHLIDSYPAAGQQLLVMGLRALLERAPSEIELDGANVIAEVSRLLEVLRDRYPDAVARAERERRSLADLVLALVEGHGRLVLTDAR